MAKLKSADKIGLTAGASTPKSIIDSVEQDLKAV
jgi:4-hydroxy-3-methylbut-2-enyl diphosphate reductase IspH